MASKLRVISSSNVDRRSGNPYGWAMAEELRRVGAEVRRFDGGSVSRWPADVLLIHWPEASLRHSDLRRALAGTLRTLVKLAIVRLRGIPIVWTVHNLDAHDGRHPVLERIFWTLFIPTVSAHISLTETGRDLAFARFPRLRRLPGEVIRHPHYRDIHDPPPDSRAARRALGLTAPVVFGSVGAISPYKGVVELIGAFVAAADLDAELLIAGPPDSPAAADSLRSAAEGDARVHLLLRGLTDEELVTSVTAADVVVLPYREILNSGSAIFALSFKRPVLVPGIGALPDLAASEGPAWVRIYPEHTLGPATLMAAAHWASEPRQGLPLEGRTWAAAGAETMDLLIRIAKRNTSNTRASRG